MVDGEAAVQGETAGGKPLPERQPEAHDCQHRQNGVQNHARFVKREGRGSKRKGAGRIGGLLDRWIVGLLD